ncbi:hypothetical protein N0V82_002252 [Gnomoniopsis sp. IMI 355080]|nr:hypothetical protein N0V82_002252 [Gnomoniopsis sp. IMI 355080]
MATRPPPLLLTKRLTSFLALNLTPTLNTLLLLTPDGKLLAYASNPSLPVTTLRTHGTVAASLFAIHTSGTDRETVGGALGGRGDGGGSAPEDAPLAVTIQLETGVVLVIRRLRCSMLFVAMGPPQPISTENSSRPQTQHQQHAHFQPLAGAIAGTAGSSPAHTNGDQSPPQPSSQNEHAEVASILSAGTGVSSSTTAGSAGVMATRRHAEELARWLDDKLGKLDLPPMGFRGHA